MKAFILKNISTLGPVGFLPLAPGTWGTLAALIVIVLLKPSTPVYIAITILATVIGTVASNETEKFLNKKDSGHIVIDEFSGYFFAMAFLPLSAGYLFSSFILFRAFDILKPRPIRRLEGLGGGIGVMLDDIAAGVIANLILQLWRLLT